MKGADLRSFLHIVLIIAFCAMPACASNWNPAERVPQVGTIIAKKNSLPPSIKFETVNGPPNNKYAITANTIQIDYNNLIYASNDNEVAFIISEELGEIIVKNITPNSKFYDSKEIDAMGVDLMINGGYNPLAGISVVTKMPKTPVENVTNKPANTEQAETIYDYISYNYPSKILAGYNSDEYKEFIAYIQPILDERKINKKKYKSYNKSQTKFNLNRTKKLGKYDETTSKLRSWGVTSELLQSITEPEEKLY